MQIIIVQDICHIPSAIYLKMEGEKGIAPTHVPTKHAWEILYHQS
jgi:hypothetical protein